MIDSWHARRIGRRLAVESLDQRDLLAGNVTASVVGNDLVITGDATDNGVYVSNLGGDLVEVRGIDQGGSATTINSSGSFSHQFSSPGGVLIDLAGGDDKLGIGDIASLAVIDTPSPGINIASPLPSDLTADFFPHEMSLPAGLQVNLGDGNDLALIKAFVPGGVDIDGGSDAGDDFVLYRDATTPTQASPHVTLDLGDGDNHAGIYLTTVNGFTAITSGGGADQIVALIESVCDLSISGGASDDYLGFSTPILGDGSRATFLYITGGNGDDQILGQDFGAGALTIDAGDGDNNITLIGPKIGGNLIVSAGSGDDMLSITDGHDNRRPFENVSGLPAEFYTGYLGAAVLIDLGDGNQGPLTPSFSATPLTIGSFVRGETGSFVVRGPFTYIGGADVDALSLMALTVLGRIEVDTGAGGNLFRLGVAQVYGDVLVTGSDTAADGLDVSASYLHGSLRMDGGALNDSLSINSQFPGLSSVILGLVELDGGDGIDYLTFNTLDSYSQRLYAPTGVQAFGGAGDDTILLDALTTPFALAYGEDGNDTLIQMFHSSNFVLLDGGEDSDKFTFDPFKFGRGHYSGINSLHLIDVEVDATADYD